MELEPNPSDRKRGGPSATKVRWLEAIAGVLLLWIVFLGSLALLVLWRLCSASAAGSAALSFCKLFAWP